MWQRVGVLVALVGLACAGPPPPTPNEWRAESFAGGHAASIMSPDTYTDRRTPAGQVTLRYECGRAVPSIVVETDSSPRKQLGGDGVLVTMWWDETPMYINDAAREWNSFRIQSMAATEALFASSTLTVSWLPESGDQARVTFDLLGRNDVLIATQDRCGWAEE